ncbi:MAG: phosphatase PAP2 family protein [SAR202 cluster bacterium]|nr:phosphatase PAP2 family protein [SAR202 cluster bacterium]
MIAAIWAKCAGLIEIALYIGAYLVYLATKGLVHADFQAVGLDNGDKIVSLQKDLGFLWEPGWQSWAVENAKSLVVTMNWVYIVTYWPVIMLVALVLFINNRQDYYFYRTVVFVNLAGALLTFMVFPAASPFAIPGVGLLNTIQEYGPTFYGSEDMASFYNISAAMPSLHFSWTVILGVLFWRTLRGPCRALALLYPVLTFAAIVLTGNHFILDAVAGGALAAGAFVIVLLLRFTVWPVRRALRSPTI